MAGDGRLKLNRFQDFALKIYCNAYGGELAAILARRRCTKPLRGRGETIRRTGLQNLGLQLLSGRYCLG